MMCHGNAKYVSRLLEKNEMTYDRYLESDELVKVLRVTALVETVAIEMQYVK